MTRMTCALLFVLGFASPLSAQGFLVDDNRAPVRSLFAVERQSVTITIRDQVADIEIEQQFVNVSDVNTEARFMFPVPEGAKISGFALKLGDAALAGETVAAGAARRVYRESCRRKSDAALLEYVGRALYRSVPFAFPKGEPRRIRMTYSELLPKESDMVRLRLPLSLAKFTQRPIGELKITVKIHATGDIKNVYSPTHAITVSRADEHDALAEYTARNVQPRRDLELLYAVDDSAIGASLLTYRPEKDRPGTFLFLASPRVKVHSTKPEPKDIVFVLDRSGSMQADRKIEQAREALSFILRSLNDGDRFSVVSFNNVVETLSDALLKYEPDVKTRALEFVSGIQANGGTDINSAILRAAEFFDGEERMHMILFLTDGLPTVGETNINKITANFKKANGKNIRFFNFGVGYDVNTTLLDKLARENNGLAENISPGENLEAFVSDFYRKIQSPILANLRVAYGSAKVSDLHPRKLPDLFTGGQIVVAGKYNGAGPTTITLTGTSQGEEKEFKYDVTFDAHSVGEDRLYVERIWATREIGHIVDMIQLYGESDELVREIVELSTRFGIITEYTAFLTTEGCDVKDTGANIESCKNELKNMKATGGRGVNQTMSKKANMRAQQAQSVSQWRDKDGNTVTAQGVRNVGRKTFYLKKNTWQDLDMEKADKVVEVPYFSEEFYKLLEEKPALNKFVTDNKPVQVKHDGVVYSFTKKK